MWRRHKRAKKVGTPLCWERYRQSRNRVVAALHSSKKAAFGRLSKKSSSPKEFWFTYRSISTTYERVPSKITDGISSESSPSGKAALLNKQFASSFSVRYTSPAAPTRSEDTFGLSTITCTSIDVLKELMRMRPTVASGPDCISSRMLKGAVSAYLSTLFNMSLSTGVFPSAWNVQCDPYL